MAKWFMGLPTHRKVLFVLAGGMLTLVFDAFIAHFSWSRSNMKWNQWPPVIYGVVATLLLALATFKQLEFKRESRTLFWTGLVGMVVGLAGVYFHAIDVVESLEGEELTVVNLGKILAASAPLFAPAAYSGVGLLLMTLKALTGASARQAALEKQFVAQPMAAGVGSDRKAAVQ